MFNGPHAAIVFHGNDHIIRNNTITKFVTDSDDAGLFIQDEIGLPEGP